MQKTEPKTEQGKASTVTQTWMAYCGCGQAVNAHDQVRHDVWVTVQIANLRNRVATLAFVVFGALICKILVWIVGLFWPNA